MSADFKKIASVEIEEFKAEYRARFPGRSTDDLRDEDLLEEMPEVTLTSSPRLVPVVTGVSPTCST